MVAGDLSVIVNGLLTFSSHDHLLSLTLVCPLVISLAKHNIKGQTSLIMHCIIISSECVS